MNKIFYLLLLILSLSAWGQKSITISGYVGDEKTGEKLPGVSLYFNNQFATTNEYGFYTIIIKQGTYVVDIVYVGYKNFSKKVIVTETVKLDFVISEALNDLDEVVVTSSGKKNNAIATEMSTNTLKAATIKKLPALLGEPDVLKAIQLLPGVASVNEASSGFNVRGGSADQNLILLDDATIYNASHLFGFFSVFNSDAIKDVKLYKGGIPAYYGGRLSSVLDVKQKEGNSKEFNGGAGIGLIASRVYVEGPMFKNKDGEGRGSYMITGRRSYIDAFTFLSDEFSDTKLFFYDLNLKTNYDLNKSNTIFLSGYFGRDSFKLPNLLGTSWGNATGTLRWTSELSDKLFFQTSAIYSNYSYELDNLRSGSEFRWKSDITNFNLKPRLTWNATSSIIVKTGIDATYYQFNPGKISSIEGSAVNPETFQSNTAFENALYSEIEYEISKKIAVQAGWRWSSFFRLGNENIRQYETGNPLTYNAQQNTYQENAQTGTKKYSSGETIEQFSNVEPRLALGYMLNDESSLKLGYNRMYQYIHLVTNTTSPTPLDVWTPSGPYIKPQFADQIAVGYFGNLKDRKYDFSIETYYKKLSNVTDFKEGADLLFREDIETQVVQGEGRSYGLEFQLNKNQGNFTGWVSYTLSKSETKIKGINNSNYYANNADQLHRLNVVGFYKFSKRWDFGSVFTLSSGRPVTYPTGKYVQNGLVVADYDDRNGSRLPAYHRLDLSATLNPKPNTNRTGKWIFSLANVYNRQNASSIYFREISEVNDVEVATGRTEATKLSFFGIVPSVTYEFKF